MKKIYPRCYGSVLALAALLLSTSSATAQLTWRANVPDIFQHQQWGSDATIPGGAAGAGDPTWEARYQPAMPPEPEKGNFGGWCFQTAVVNQLYHFRQRGYNTFGPLAGPPDNPVTVNAIHEEVQDFNVDYGNTFDGNPKSNANRINEILNLRGAGPDQGIAGLRAQNFLQQGTSIFYRNAKGEDTKFGKGTIYDHVRAVNQAGDLANLRLTLETATSKLWWEGPSPGRGNFHVVTVAGIDTAGNGTLWFSDPDSNKGNANANAGWGASLANWKAAPAGVPTKARRYNAGDAYVPAGAAPTAAERNQLYYEGLLANTKTSFTIPAGASDRYDDVEIKYLESLEIIKGAVKPAPVGGPPPGEGKRYQVSPGAGSNSIINEIWLFPSRAVEKIINLFSSGFGGTAPSSAWNWTLMPGLTDAPSSAPFLSSLDNTPGMDRYGNPRVDGGLYLTVNPSDPFWIGRPLGLVGNELLEFQYETAGDVALEGWDFLYNDFQDTSLLSLGVQTAGPNSGYTLPHIQSIPEPATAVLMMLATLGLSRRRCR